jgi:polyphosphate kinase 2 (PPK2 family)
MDENRKTKVSDAQNDQSEQSDPKLKLKRKEYEEQLAKLHAELVKLQFWVKHTGARIVVIFEGKDAAGKGGVIKRITE